MKPYVFSARQFERDRVGWQQSGEDITYTKNTAASEEGGPCYDKEGKYFKLSFTISTEFEDDCLEIAYCPPYTYTRLT
jgi:hypothetical protein